MASWDKITLFKFQQLDIINSKPEVSEIDKTLFSTCIIYDYTEYELDNLPIKKVNKLTQKLTKIFEVPFNPKPFKRIGKYFINYEVSKFTFGQYVELAFFLNAKPVQTAHYTMASISNLLFLKNNSNHHRKKAEYFLRQPVLKIMGSLSLIIEKFKAFNKEYEALFGLDKDVSGEDAQTSQFNKKYGWIYSASQVAEYERITLDSAFRLPVRQALNDLAYLKAKAKYETELAKFEAKRLNRK